MDDTPERGPLEKMRADELAGFPLRPSFEGLVADRLGEVDGADAAIGGAAVTIASSSPADVDQAFASTVGQAAEDLDPTAILSPVVIAEQIDSADNLDGIRQGVLRYLPSPDTEPQVDLVPPPPVPEDLAPPPDGPIDQPLPPPF